MKPLLYIFDLDGTLVDTRVDITNAINEMLSHYSIPPKSVEEVTSYVGNGFIPLIKRCLSVRKDLENQVDKALEYFRDAYARRLVENTRLYPGIKELLEKLNSSEDRALMAILTNKDVNYANEIIKKLGIGKYFSIVVGGNSLPKKKPSPDGVYHILNKTGIVREMVLLIGDGGNDVLTAKNAGIKSVFVRWGFKDEESLPLKPDYVVSNPLEILNISI